MNLVRVKARAAHLKAQWLTQLTWSSSTAKQYLKYNETLNVTLPKKYEKGTLVHISDNLFEWVLENNKQSSHQRLQAMLVQQEKIFQSTVYRKSEVEMIYKTYGVSFWQSGTKAKLSEKLVEKIQASEHILHPYLGLLRTGTATRTLCRSCHSHEPNPQGYPSTTLQGV